MKIETKRYSDGTTATGVAPLPDLSPAQQDAQKMSSTMPPAVQVPIEHRLREVPKSLRLLLETGTKDVHSGTTGGAARNPIGELCQLIADCYDARTGKVKIPGFYKDVAKITRRERESFLSSGFNVNHFKRAHELKRIRSGSAADVMERLWTQPTFEVHGIVGGYTGPGVKTAIAPDSYSGFKGMARATELGKMLESRHPKVPHAHLVFLGVATAAQGQGVGSALLKHSLEPVDAAHLPAYLETTTARNVALYERHGFEVTDKFELPGVTFWTMFRQAR